MKGRVRIGVYALAVSEATLLLVRMASGYPSAGSWTLPGGGLEFGESPEQGLNRELAEETGLGGTIESIVGINSIVFPPRDARPQPAQAIRIVYSVTCVGDPVAEEGGSTDLAEWVPVERVPELDLVDLVTWAMEAAGIRSGPG